MKPDKEKKPKKPKKKDLGKDGEKITMAIKEFVAARVDAIIKEVTVTVAASGTSGSSAADPRLKGGMILGMYPTTNQDQGIDTVALNADGSVTVTLRLAATADNVFKVMVLN